MCAVLSVAAAAEVTAEVDVLLAHALSQSEVLTRRTKLLLLLQLPLQREAPLPLAQHLALLKLRPASLRLHPSSLRVILLQIIALRHRRFVE